MLKNFNIILRFLLEISSLIFVGYWGYIYGKGNIQKVILMFLPSIFIAVIWGIFGAPKAPYRLPDFTRSLLIIAIYLIAANCLMFAGKKNVAIIFLVVALLNSGLMILWEQ